MINKIKKIIFHSLLVISFLVLVESADAAARRGSVGVSGRGSFGSGGYTYGPRGGGYNERMYYRGYSEREVGRDFDSTGYGVYGGSGSIYYYGQPATPSPIYPYYSPYYNSPVQEYSY